MRPGWVECEAFSSLECWKRDQENEWAGREGGGREAGVACGKCEYCQKANGVMWKPVDDCRTETAAVSCHTWLTVPTHTHTEYTHIQPKSYTS